MDGYQTFLKTQGLRKRIRKNANLSPSQSTQDIMNELSIRPTKTTPTIKLNPQTGILEIGGVSIPENVSVFYAPVLDWLRDYVKKPAERTVLKFNFDYFNTATSKIFMELITELESMEDSAEKCTIEWHYKSSDPDMREAGEDYALITRIPCHFLQEEG